MSIFEGVVQEEIDRLNRSIEIYKQLLSDLPRGTIFVRKMGNSSFVYRKWKINGLVYSKYIGKYDSEIVKQEIVKSQEFKRVSLNLRMATNELSRLRKVCKVYDRKREQTKGASRSIRKRGNSL